MNETSKKLIEAVRLDLTPSLGVTEPGAIAFAAASAARALGGKPEKVTVRLNSGIYKNSFTCFVPGTDGMGCAFAAALGAVAGDPSLGLRALEKTDEADIAQAKRLAESGAATACIGAISPDISILAEVVSENGRAEALLKGRHDGLISLKVNGRELAGKNAPRECASGFRVSGCSFDELIECVNTAEGLDFIDEAVRTDLVLFEEGKKSGLIPLTEARLGLEPASCRERAELVTAGAIEARVRGAKAPAMAITGSGSHGILCTLPVHEAAVFYGFGQEAERRALLLSMLTTMWIKEQSGLLSTACGCVLAGGTGAALGVTYLLARGEKGSALKTMLTNALNSMAASVTGMICHGGNTGCSLKAAVGVNMAFGAAEMALRGAGAESVHGILGNTAEDTMLNMALIARDMLPVEKTILGIMEKKAAE